MFYGWVILLILCVNYLCVVGYISYTYGTILLPMATELGLTMTQTAGAMTASTFTFAVLSLLVGQLVGKKLRAKTVTLLATAAGIAVGISMARMHGYFFYLLCYIALVSMIYFTGSGLTSQILLTNWFVRRRNTALAVLMAMGGVAGFLYPPLATLLMQHTGTWRSIWLVLAGMSAAAFVLSLVFLKEKPADIGLEPYGADDGQREAVRSAGYITKFSFTQGEALRTPFFYVCIFIYFGAAVGGSLVTAYLVAHLTLQGISPLAAASAISVFAFCNMWGRIVSGMLQDRYDPRTIVKIAFPAMGALLLALPLVRTSAQAYVFAVLFGVCFSMTFSCPFSILMNTYGLEHYGQLFSLDYAGYTVLNTTMGILPGIAFDATGSYTLYFYAVAVFLFMTTVLLFIVKTPKKETA